MYALIDAHNIIVNLIVYDGEAEYTPPEALTLVKIPDGATADIGETYSPS